MSNRTINSKAWTGLVIIGLILMAACMPSAEVEEKPRIMVSILPQKFFLEKIAGDRFHVQVMIPPGESPATYDPTAEQMKHLAGSKIYFLVGHLLFEEAWIKGMEKKMSGTVFVNTSRGIRYEAGVHTGHDHPHGDVDPHVWMSVSNVRILVANMTEALSTHFPEHKQEFLGNAEKFGNALDSLDQEIRKTSSEIRMKKFIIYHPALTYFAADYGFTQIPIERNGKEPSSKYLKSVIDRARIENIQLIFVQKQFNQQEARTLEQEINGTVVLIDPLAYPWMEEMKSIANALASYSKTATYE